MATNLKRIIETEIVKLVKKSYGEAFKLTYKHGIRIKSTDARTINATAVSVHIAIANNPIPRIILKKGWAKEFNRVFDNIFVVDNSNGNPELEVITANQVFGYVEALLKLTEEFKDKDFGIYELIKRLKDLVGSL
jgi:hypothetical protein